MPQNLFGEAEEEVKPAIEMVSSEPAKETDAVDLSKMGEAEALEKTKRGAERVLAGEAVFAVLAAGASSRMSAKEAGKHIQGMSEEATNIESKAAVPINDQGDTFLSLYIDNVVKMLEEIKGKATAAREDTSAMKNNTILIMTSARYEAEQVKIIRETLKKKGYELKGIKGKAGSYTIVDKDGNVLCNIQLFRQDSGTVKYATVEQVRSMRSKYASEEEYYTALYFAYEQERAGKTEFKEESSPLGHGEFWHQMVAKGVYGDLVGRGNKFISLRNIDNAAALMNDVLLQEVATMEEEGADVLIEASKNAPGLAGGGFIIERDAEGRTYARQYEFQANPDVKKSELFNDAVGIFNIEAIARIYKADGQSVEDFFKEYDRLAKAGDMEGLRAISERWKKKFKTYPAIKQTGSAYSVAIPTGVSVEGLTAEEAAGIRALAGKTVSARLCSEKTESSAWGVSCIDEIRTMLSLVGNGSNLDAVIEGLNKEGKTYSDLTWAEKLPILRSLRFLGTKQWTLSEDALIKIMNTLNEGLPEGEKITSVDDMRVLLRAETYVGNKEIIQDYVRYVKEEQSYLPQNLFGEVIEAPKTAMGVAAETATEAVQNTAATPAVPVQKQVINWIFGKGENTVSKKVSINIEELLETKAGHTDLETVNEPFVSLEDRKGIKERLEAKGVTVREVKNADGTTTLELFAEGKFVGKIDSKGYLSNSRGQQLKFNVMLDENTLDIHFHLNKNSRDLLNLLDDQTRNHILESAKLVLMTDFISNLTLERKMMKLLFSEALTSANIENLSLDSDFRRAIESIIKGNTLNYSGSELKSLLRVDSLEFDALLKANAIDSVKSVSRQEVPLNVKAKTDIAKALLSFGRSGVTSILLRGTYNADTIKFIREHGFDVVVEVDYEEVCTTDNIADVEVIKGVKLGSCVENGLSGLRFKIASSSRVTTLKADYDANIAKLNNLMFRTIPTISYNFTGDVLTANAEDIIRFVESENTELFIDISNVKDEDLESLLKQFEGLANDFKLMVGVNDNRDEKARMVLSKFQGIALFANTVRRGSIDNINKFIDSLGYNPRFAGRNVALDNLFKNGVTVTTEDIKKLLEGTEEINESKLRSLLTETAIKEILDLTPKTNGERTAKDLTITTREYILGSMIAEIESEIITPDVKAGEKNYKVLVGAALLMMVNGESLDNIKADLDKVKITGEGSLSQLLNNEANSVYARVAKSILSMWKGKDMKIKIENPEADSIALTGLIKLILTMDTILPEEGLLDSSMNVSLDGIKGILSAA